jgi:hypothetical protein
MASKWDNDLKYPWQQKGKDKCGELLKEADKALEKATEQEQLRQG